MTQLVSLASHTLAHREEGSGDMQFKFGRAVLIRIYNACVYWNPPIKFELRCTMCITEMVKNWQKSAKSVIKTKESPSPAYLFLCVARHLWNWDQKNSISRSPLQCGITWERNHTLSTFLWQIHVTQPFLSVPGRLRLCKGCKLSILLYNNTWNLSHLEDH